MAPEDAPATKKDLAELKNTLDSRIDRMQADLQEQMRDMQTELLKAFLPWQEQVWTQFRTLDTNTTNTVVGIKQRMDIVERRLWEIEKKLLLEPPAA